MADTYRNFDELSQKEVAGVDYRILLRRSRAVFAIVAPHGGGIEAGTSEVAEAIASEEFSFYSFEGIKSPATLSFILRAPGSTNPCASI